MGRVGVDDLEDLRSLRLDQARQRELLAAQSECTFVFGDEDGWPSGVVMTYLYEDDTFWLTAVEGRAHTRGLDSDPQVTIVVSNRGTSLPGRRMLAVRGIGTVHRDEETKSWFLDRFTSTHPSGDPKDWRRLLDSPRRVVFKVRVVKVAVSHDSSKMPGHGRGGTGGSDRGGDPKLSNEME